MQGYGSFVESQIANYLCKKHYDNLSTHWRRLVKMMIPTIEDDDIIYCENVAARIKQDIFIVARGEKKTISIKSGKDASLHCELLDSFCTFLRHLNVSEYHIETLRLYHYGDGTIDGTGAERDDVVTVKVKLADRIQKFNEELNKPEYLRNILYRFLSFGTLNQKDHVDYLYYGNLYVGGLYDMKDLIDFFTIEHTVNIKGIHFGPFFYCAFYRFADKDSKGEKNRHYLTIRWFGHEIDLEKFVKYQKKINQGSTHISSSFEL